MRRAARRTASRRARPRAFQHGRAQACIAKQHRLGGITYWEQSLDPTDELLDAIWRGLH